MRLLREASSKGSPQSAMGMAWTWGEEGASKGYIHAHKILRFTIFACSFLIAQSSMVDVPYELSHGNLGKQELNPFQG